MAIQYGSMTKCIEQMRKGLKRHNYYIEKVWREYYDDGSMRLEKYKFRVSKEKYYTWMCLVMPHGG